MQSEELPGIVDTERLESFNPSPGLCQHPTQGSTRSFPSNIPIDHVSQGPAFQKVCPRCRGDMSDDVLSPALADAIRKLIRMEMEGRSDEGQAKQLPPYIGSIVKNSVERGVVQEETETETETEVQTFEAGENEAVELASAEAEEPATRRPSGTTVHGGGNRRKEVAYSAPRRASGDGTACHRRPLDEAHRQPSLTGHQAEHMWGLAAASGQTTHRAPAADARAGGRKTLERDQSTRWTACTKEVGVAREMSVGQQDALDQRDWETTAENAYGAFIHTSLQSGLWRALCLCGPMVLVSVLIQFTFAWELFQVLPLDRAHQTACDIPSSIQLAAVGVFVTLMLNNVPGMVAASCISLGSTEFRLLDEDQEEGARGLVHTVSVTDAQKAATFLLAVATEMVTWAGIFVSGILFILSSETVDLVIRSTVAILFVQNVDEVIFDSCCPERIKENLRNTKYRKERVLTRRFAIDANRVVRMAEIYSLFVHLPVLALISGAIVFGLRAHPSFDCLPWEVGKG